MAKHFTKKPKIAQMPTPEASESGAVATAAPPETPFDPPKAEPLKKNPVGRPPVKKDAPAAPPRSVTFWQRVEQIAFEDWGTRAKIRVYRLAPLIDRLRGSECKYIRSYEEALTEDKLKQDEGSGRYRLYLGFKTAGITNEKELDMMEFDILDQNFPPRIPPGEWMNDPRNNQWAWAKPPNPTGPNYLTNNQPQPAAAPAVNPLDGVIAGMRLATDMRKEVRDEFRPAEQQQQPAAAPAPVDPWAAAERILNMRSDNPMVTVLQEELKAVRDQMAEQNKNMAHMQEKMFEAKLEALKATLQPTQQQQSKGLLEQAGELAKFMGLEPAEMMKKMMGVEGEPVKSKMSGWMQFVSDIAPTALNSPILTAIASRLMSPSGQPAPSFPAQPPATNGAAAPNPQQELFAFVNNTVTPALIEYLSTGNSGIAFAEWMFNGYPEKLQQLQTLEYPGMPGLKGAPVILELYKHSPAWQELRKFEAQLPKFIEQFCSYDPDKEEDNEPGQTIDLKPEPSNDPDNHPTGDF